ncbi:MAG: S8 family serine peptidase [Gemmatimonadota bacterium]|nr:MAG: S8 family serine peptidase [Gemmatimonadota bacterium]
MSNKYFVKVVFIAVFTIVFSVSSDAIEKITPALRNVMETSSPEKLIPVSIRMKPQISQIYLQTITAGMAKREKRAAVISELKSFAQRSQAELLDFLRGHERAGQAAHVGSHWLSNGISANLTRKVIEVVADFEEVERISWDRVLPPFEENLTKDRSGLSIKSSSDIAEGVLKINAPGVWDKGYTGQGVLIAIIDSGVDYTHPDLSDHMWDGSGQYYEYPPESGNWFELIHHGFDFVGIDTNNPIADNDPMD